LNIGKYITINKYKNVLCASYKENGIPQFRTLDKFKKKKQKKVFYNQVSLGIKILSKRKPMNIKLFKKNSVQLTGFTKISDLIEVIDVLNSVLLEEKYIFVTEKDENGNYRRVPKLIEFIKDINYFSPDNIFDIKICMINSNYKIGFHIDRTRVFEKLYDGYNSEDQINPMSQYKNKNKITDPTKRQIYLSFEKNIHVSIDIKYEILNRIDKKSKFISIFIFETGSVIITGVKSIQELEQAYVFILELTTKHYKDIVKIDLDF
jgi:hypothetical protein